MVPGAMVNGFVFPVNVRFFMPYINRFLSADTIVPDPQNPQSYNRYSYALNNPVRYTDPSGHFIACGVSGEDCEDDRDAMIELYLESEAELPLVLPLMLDGEIIGREYFMPQGSEQSVKDPDSFLYKGGRVLAASGIGLDIVEMILAIPGAGTGLGVVDAGVTYFAGVFTGDNYFPILGLSTAPDGLPEDMFSINQDVLVNTGEAFVPVFTGYAKGAAFMSAATPGVVDELLAVAALNLIDAGTSFGSAIYDAGRFDGSFQNHLTVGIAGKELILVHWP